VNCAIDRAGLGPCFGQSGFAKFESREVLHNNRLRGSEMNDSTSAEHAPSDPANFRFDTKNIEWTDFVTEGCYYRILDVNVCRE
jgi:hypothetical protein